MGAKKQLKKLCRLTQAFNSSLELQPVLDSVLDGIVDLTGAERGFVILIDDEENLDFCSARTGHQSIDCPETDVSRRVIEKVICTHKALRLLNPDAVETNRVRQTGIKQILCAPLIVQDRLIGVLYVDSLHRDLITRADCSLLEMFASNAALAISNAQHHRQEILRVRIDGEIELAKQLQTSLIPQSMPHLEGWELAAYWKPAFEVAGDFYDFVPLADGRLGVAISDVSDKGLPSAIFMAITRSLIRASVATASSPDECIGLANRLVCDDAVDGMFVTLFYMELAPDGCVHYVNAGHNPPFLKRADSLIVERLSRTGMALGVLPDVSYAQRVVMLQPGDTLLMYTDGLTEALDVDDNEFGIGRLEHMITSLPRYSSRGLIEYLEEQLLQFVENAPQQDDITLVVARRT